MIKVNHSLCTLCEICVGVCPFSALMREDDKIVVLDTFRLCKICLKHCPENALSLEVTASRSEHNLADYSGVLVVAECSGDSVHPVTYELIGKGRELADKAGEKLSCVVIGHDIADICDQLLEYGVDRCYAVDYPELAQMRVEPYTNALEEVSLKIKPSIVLLAATPTGRTLAPRLATRLRTGLTADCTTLEVRNGSELVQIRPAFGGNIMAQIVTPKHRPQLATMRYKVMEPAVKERKPDARVETLQLLANQLESKAQVVKSRRKPPEESISDAEIIVAAGRGVRSEQSLAMVAELAALLGGQLGVTRPLVENGWADYTRQIGLSGRTVRPKLLITCGISGAVQFTASITGAETVVAINSDENAPIFKNAHYGLVGDLNEIVPALIDGLREV